MPDIFVSADTSYNSSYFEKLLAKNVLNTFTLEYFDKNREVISSRYKTFADFQKGFQIGPEMIKEFIERAEKEGIKYNEDEFNRSREGILIVLKGLIATNIWETNEYFQVINRNDKVIAEAIKILEDRKFYNNTLGYR